MLIFSKHNIPKVRKSSVVLERYNHVLVSFVFSYVFRFHSAFHGSKS